MSSSLDSCDVRSRRALVIIAVAATAAGSTALPPSVRGNAASLRAGDACRERDYSIALSSWHVRGDTFAAVGILTDRAACSLETSLLLTIRDRDGGRTRTVRGNPATWRVDKQLERFSQLVHTWAWRNSCRSARARVLVESGNGVRVGVRAVPAPKCRDKRSPSRLLDLGTGTRSLPHKGRIPAHVLPSGTPIPISPALVRVKNAWLVSDGLTLVAVYAGEAGNDPSLGRFVIVRQNLLFGVQTRDIVDAGAVGATTISEAPTGASVETSAQRADLGFTSTSGRSGILHLADDTTQLRP